MKQFKTPSIFTSIKTKYENLPELQQLVLLWFVATIIVTCTLAYATLFPPTNVRQFKFPTEESIRNENILKIESMVEIAKSKDYEFPNLPENIFRLASLTHNTYDKGLCLKYSSVSACEALKAEFAFKINKAADDKIRKANLVREIELRQLEQ
ncbi:hypothetical protein GR140_19020 [Pseudomonas putida]|uniref:hypothetical protein n=1 Tax=Pseudomonas putida TaxID=303 RepID=UPI001BB05CD4|nr:hypothetical protein [Pseudomonas putida]QUG90758.1 hypothetical protein GR140_19020 [Pseudomonas putida]